MYQNSTFSILEINKLTLSKQFAPKRRKIRLLNIYHWPRGFWQHCEGFHLMLKNFMVVTFNIQQFQSRDLMFYPVRVAEYNLPFRPLVAIWTVATFEGKVWAVKHSVSRSWLLPPLSYDLRSTPLPLPGMLLGFELDTLWSNRHTLQLTVHTVENCPLYLTIQGQRLCLYLTCFWVLSWTP